MWLHADEREDPNAVPTHLDSLENNPNIPQVVKDVVVPTLRMKGQTLPVSTFLDIADGRIPTGTSKYEKRGVATQIPVWDEEACVKCNDCSLSCPHAAIRPFLVTEDEVEAAPEGFKHIAGVKNYRFSIQISPFDCMGCGVCAEVCRDEALTMVPVKDLDLKQCSDLWEYAFELPNRGDEIKRIDAGTLQYRQPLLEFSGACAGCGQTPYAKLLTQLFGERMIIANATGCSLIWTASFPVTAYTTSYRGRGPSWGNSLFEDNAEYGFGMVCATSHRRRALSDRVEKLMDTAEDAELKKKLDAWAVKKDDPHASMTTGDALIDLFSDRPELLNDPLVKEISKSSDLFTKPSHWLIGGDGWAYDIGYGGLDHVLAQSVDLNVLVFDNEAYANTGFQVSKSTPHGGVTKFALAGKRGHKKELGLMAMQYGHVYVATVSLGGNKNNLVKVLMEAEAYPGPSLIITYCPCIGHGIEGSMCQVNEQERLAVLTGYWPLYKYNPLLKEQGKNPFTLVSKKPSVPLEKFLDTQIRFTAMKKENPKLVRSLYDGLKKDIDSRWKRLERMAAEE
jgi:pyruvate-ferredoxin/flavodoxin oxidoreductase